MIERETKERLRQELAALAAVDGVSGHEERVIAALQTGLRPLVDRVEVDAIGNIYATRGGGPGPHLMLAAHSDEIGALVSAIEENGFIRFTTVGGVPDLLLIGRKVRIRDLRGVIGVRPGHLQSTQEARTVPPAADLYIDLGFATAEEVRSLGIRPGDPIAWQSVVEPVANEDRVAGKGIDNRTGCLVLLETLRALQGEELPGPLTAVIAVQEEVGLKGAAIAAERVHPDAAIVIDTVPCTDTPDSLHVRTFPVRLGAGPVFQVSSGERASGYLMPQAIREYLTHAAELAGIPYQLATFSYGNTDAASVYVSAGGIPTAAVTIARRYSHSPVEMLDLNDMLATIRLCIAIVRSAEKFPLTPLA